MFWDGAFNWFAMVLITLRYLIGRCFNVELNNLSSNESLSNNAHSTYPRLSEGKQSAVGGSWRYLNDSGSGRGERGCKNEGSQLVNRADLRGNTQKHTGTHLFFPPSSVISEVDIGAGKKVRSRDESP